MIHPLANFFSFFHKHITHAVVAHYGDFTLDLTKLTLEPPKDVSHGDMSTNLALILTKTLGKPPREIAAAWLPILHNMMPEGTRIEIAGPGFINFTMPHAFWHTQLQAILAHPSTYIPEQIGEGKKIHIEFVSANPTGPLHTGHSRNAVLGDVLASTLEAVGYKVHREYYINDAGAQVDTLARSIHLRYLQLFEYAIAENAFAGLYPGEYVIDLAKALQNEFGDLFISQDENVWMQSIRAFAIEKVMEWIKDDLARLGITMDAYVSEAALVNAGKVEHALHILEQQGDLYTGVLAPPKGMVVEDFEPRPQTLFRSTAYGDVVDRALRKSDGSWSYFAPDIAYHLDKFERGYDDLIDVLSADHMGYFSRISAAVKAVTQQQASVQIRDYQMVNFLDNGVPVKMSKRAGTFITLSDLLDRVGKDAVRFSMMTRHHDVVMDFDFAKVVEHSKDNPVFYVQYAHARICSVLRHAKELWPHVDEEIKMLFTQKSLEKSSIDSLNHEAELALIKILAQYPRAVETAAHHREPHRLTYYLGEVSAHFHHLWNVGREHAHLRFIEEEKKELTFARLALLMATKEILAKGLSIFKITPVQEMR